MFSVYDIHYSKHLILQNINSIQKNLGTGLLLPIAVRVTVAVHVAVRTVVVIRVHVTIRVRISVQTGNVTVEVGRENMSPYIRITQG